jgi:3-hexulose-6-phosphate synthase
MKLQIAFDLFDLDRCLEIAKQVESYADRFEIGAPLLYKYGIEAIRKFKKQFPEKELLAETQIVDRGRDLTSLYIDEGIDWVTVMAEANQHVIHSVCSAAEKQKRFVMLDLLNTTHIGQSAMDAQTLGVDALLFHTSQEAKQSILAFDQWEMARGNSKLPIYIASIINRSNINQVLELKPNGIIIDKAITLSENPVEEAKFFHGLCKS